MAERAVAENGKVSKAKLKAYIDAIFNAEFMKMNDEKFMDELSTLHYKHNIVKLY